MTCECCGRDSEETVRRYGVPESTGFIKARGGRMILCRVCWGAIRYTSAGFVSPDSKVQRCLDRYRNLGK